MQLDHVTLVTPDLEGARRFFCEVAGLDEGPRPPFRVDGHWLYAQGRPVIHLIDATLAAARPPSGRVAPRIDHLAFRVGSGGEWSALLGRLHAHGVPYQLAEVPVSAELQLFVALAPGIVVEFVTAGPGASGATY
ncbi:extradiol dioxygenase [Burkholderia sp. WAC0059]|uniref:VOC family protein n=1 Tax=Burkholderia sp. WAC0059 TaxID=2066022 RepID=UPI000C7F66D2|nr:VOC family protein [Burkholderia sp. WAC0059]PLZ01681.1 extradiol dioxygenase [Burkholderia sp. WAC0059]